MHTPFISIVALALSVVVLVAQGHAASPEPTVSPDLSRTSQPVSPRSTVHKVVFPYLLSHDINHEDYYFSQLLRLALDKTTSEFGPWQYGMYTEWLRDKRLRFALNKGTVDVIWSTSSKALEKELRAVKIPLLKGLSQYRLLLIHEEDQARFSAINGLEALGQLRGGMGAQWPDAKVMRANGLPLVTATGYGKLFKMLAARRFDYFSRGIYQIHSEVHFYPNLPLAIEETLLLEYHGALYFFVGRDNELLANRIEAGLHLAQQDGSFDRLFYSVPRYQWAMKELKKNNRRVLTLKTFPP
ncbi:type 2 periplasmic-binding domain-containing protein [Teredinibacter purpureus]|uniref:hypothetical protein n=1 Tax=Teredinibacter purpureus TaxID=2731756 RepID=UPI0006963E74|nr:hypothetical protein [Teredinibacter purpureus]